MPAGAEDLAVLGLAAALDLALGEPPVRFHPTAWMGRTVSFLERRLPRGGRGGVAAGAVMAAVVVGGWTAAAFFAVVGLREAHPVAYILVGALLLKSTFAVRMLHQAAARVRTPLAEEDLDRARRGLPSLVSRDPVGPLRRADRRRRRGVGVREHV